MTDYKFKKGDRVRYIGSDTGTLRGETLMRGSVGAVAGTSGFPYVAWDGFTGGHDGYCGGEGKNHWGVDEDDLELLVEPSVEAFKIGQRVRVTDPTSRFSDCEGTVRLGNYIGYVAAVLDRSQGTEYFNPSQLTSIEQASESPAKPECYATAWVEDGNCYMTGDALHKTKSAADYEAKLLAGAHHGKEVAVFKLVSKHSSAVTVTSEDV